MTYAYATEHATYDDSYLLDALRRALPPPAAPGGRTLRVFDLGCGNGVVAKTLAADGYDVTAVDTSETGIEMARRAGVSGCRFEVASAYDDLGARFGLFDAVISLEVVEHLFSPAAYAQTVKGLLGPGAPAIVSTPYHGYLKNLAISITGKWDTHLAPNWEGGHIKFFSRDTLRQLFAEAGLHETAFLRAGRIAPLAKSMIGVYRAQDGRSADVARKIGQ
jgi:2-polyprenyl-6-hydroxyphenyl methylase/3-demethylubiquinone-9 3-methyltransferase